MLETNCSKCEKPFQTGRERIIELLKTSGVTEGELDRFDLLDILNVNSGKCGDTIRHRCGYPRSFTSKADNFYEKYNEQINRKNVQLKRKAEVEKDIADLRKILEVNETIEKEIDAEIAKISDEADKIDNQCIEETGMSANFWKKPDTRPEKIKPKTEKSQEPKKEASELEKEPEKEEPPKEEPEKQVNVDEMITRLKEIHSEFLEKAKDGKLNSIARKEYEKGNINAAFREYFIYMWTEYGKVPDKVDHVISNMPEFNQEQQKENIDEIQTVTLVCRKCQHEEEFTGTKKDIIKQIKKPHINCKGDVEIKDASKYILTIKIVDGYQDYMVKGMENLKNKRINEGRKAFDYNFNDNEVVITVDSWIGRDGAKDLLDFLVRTSSNYSGKLQENYQVDWL